MLMPIPITIIPKVNNNPLDQFQVDGVLTPEFTQHVLSLIPNNLNKAYSLYKSIKKSGYMCEIDQFEIMQEAFVKAYNTNLTYQQHLEKEGF